MSQDILTKKFKTMFELRNAEYKIDWKKYRNTIILGIVLITIFFGWFFVLMLGIPTFLVFAYLFTTIPNNTFVLSEFMGVVTLASFFWAMVIIPGIVFYFIIKKILKTNQKIQNQSKMKTFLHNEILPLYLSKKFNNVHKKDGKELVAFSRVLDSSVIYGSVHQYLSEAFSGEYTKNTTKMLNTDKKRFSTSSFGVIEDTFSIEDDNEHYQIAEVSLTQIVTTDNKKKAVPFANMFIMATPADFKFNGETVVFTKEMFDIDTKGLKEDDMESTFFEDKFFVFTSDPVEARICLKTNVIDQINQLYERGIKKMFIEFKNNNVIIGIENHLKLFEPVFHREMTEKDLDGSVEEIKKLLNLTEDLKINYRSYK